MTNKLPYVSRKRHTCEASKKRRAQRVFSSVQRYLTQTLKLVVNEQKSSVRLSRDCEYLGFAFTGKRVTITVAPKKLCNRSRDSNKGTTDCTDNTDQGQG